MRKCIALVELPISYNNKINTNIGAIIYSTLMSLTFSPTETILQKPKSVFAVPMFFFLKII